MSNDDDLLDTLTEAQELEAVSRALTRYEIEHEFRADGSGIDITDEDFYNLNGLMEDEIFFGFYADELKKLAADNLLEGMVAKGLLEPNGVDENGDKLYVLAEGVEL
jgi:hypothetical protein